MKEEAIAKRPVGRPGNILRLTEDRPLPERIKVIADYHEAARATLAQGAMYALLCGFELHAAHAQVGRYGNWEKWVESNCPFSLSTAWRYMQAAERKAKDIPNLALVKDFALGVSPHLLAPAKRDQLFDIVRTATDGESIRQLYLDLGLIKGPHKNAGGYIPPAEGVKLFAQEKGIEPDYAAWSPELQAEFRTWVRNPKAQREIFHAHTASQDWVEIIVKIRQFAIEKKTWRHLDRGEFHGGVLSLREAMEALESAHKKLIGG